MPYQLIKIEKEPVVIDGRTEQAYVAIVKKDGEDSPFRVQLENFETKDEALAQVHAWINIQTEDDRVQAENKAKDAAEANKDSIMDDINNQ